MTHPFWRSLVHSVGCMALIACVADVASAQGTDPGLSAPALVFDGPAAPIAPETITRDARGRATVRAIRLTQPLTLDGQLDEEVYQSVPGIGGFIQELPKEGEPATERTEAWVMFDANYIYVG